MIVDLIDQENWSAMGADVKGDAYEGLLEKNAQDTKSGALRASTFAMLALASTATRPQAGGCLKRADKRSRPPHNQPSPIPGFLEVVAEALAA